MRPNRAKGDKRETCRCIVVPCKHSAHPTFALALTHALGGR